MMCLEGWHIYENIALERGPRYPKSSEIDRILQGYFDFNRYRFFQDLQGFDIPGSCFFDIFEPLDVSDETAHLDGKDKFGR